MPQTTLLITKDDPGMPDLSADGRYVAIVSHHPTQVSGGAGSESGILRLDTLQHAVTLIDSGEGHAPTISSDGSRVAYETISWNTLPTNVGTIWRSNTERVLVAQPDLGKLTAASEDSVRFIAHYDRQPSAISGDGSTVILSGYPENFALDGSGSIRAVYAMDLASHTLRTVAAATTGFFEAIATSNNGKIIAFTYTAGTLSDKSYAPFVHDMVTGETTPIATGPDGGQLPLSGWFEGLQVSGNGRYVVFKGMGLLPSGALDYGTSALWMKDLQTGALRQIDSDASDSNGPRLLSDASFESISDDGRYVAFITSDAKDFGLPDAAGKHVVVRDMWTGAFAIADSEPLFTVASPKHAAISGDGQHLAIVSLTDTQEYRTYLTELPQFTTTIKDETLQGTAGADTLAGALGDDIYIVNNTHDAVLEFTGGGTDTVQASVTYTLPMYVENLTLTGDAGIGANGNELANRIVGNANANIIAAGAGNDTIETGGGADNVDGGSGSDTVQLPERAAGYSYAFTSAGVTLTDKSNSTEKITLKNVEHIEAGRLHIAYANEGHADVMFGLYQAAFGRTPDAEGMGFWLSKYTEGMGLDVIAAEFMKSNEFNTAYPAASNADLITAMYHNVLHREPDSAGFAYWKDILDQHKTDNAHVLMSFASSTENQVDIVGSMSEGYAYLLP